MLQVNTYLDSLMNLWPPGQSWFHGGPVEWTKAESQNLKWKCILSC